MLEKVPATDDEDPASLPLDAPPGGTAAGAATCFQNRMALAVPDTLALPVSAARPAGQPPMPRSVLFVPMFVQGEAVGVFEISHRDAHSRFQPRTSARWRSTSANQIGVALRLLDQRSVREQLFRTEKLAAVGRLISGVVNELQAPAGLHLQRGGDGHGSTAAGALPAVDQTISVEARKASDMVARLVSFASSEPVEARPVDLNDLLRHLAEFREREWKARGIRVRAVITDEPLPVLGSEGQLEQVMLDLIVHAEQALPASATSSSPCARMRLARKALVEIGYSGAPRRGPAGRGRRRARASGFAASIIAGHGGELRTVYPADADPRFEIELPRATRDRQPAPARDRRTRATLRSP